MIEDELPDHRLHRFRLRLAKDSGGVGCRRLRRFRSRLRGREEQGSGEEATAAASARGLFIGKPSHE